MKIRIHVILDELDKQIVDVVRGFPGVEIVQWDYSFDTAYQWTLNNREVKVDVYLASEYAQVSNTDESGELIPRDKALLNRVRDLYLLRPYVKFLLLCDPDRKQMGNIQFFTNLVSIGIYDFKIAEDLTVEKLERYIKEPKRDISHVAEFLPGGFENIRKHTSHDVKQFELETPEEKEEEESFLSTAKERLMSLFKKMPMKLPKVKKEKRAKRYELATAEKPMVTEQPKQDKVLPEEVDIPIPKPVAKIATDTIYTLGLHLEKGVVNLNSWEQLITAMEFVVPNIVLLSSDVENLIEKIKHLKEEYGSMVVIIGDVEDNRVLYAGADAYYKEWDDIIYKRLLDDTKNRDSLTGLYDRKYFEDYLERQIRQYHSHQRPFSILLIDIDFFKKVNDTYGHQAGDKVLRKLAHFLSENTRCTDTVARYGGEEFIVVFPNTTKEMAKQIAQQLRHKWHHKGIPEVTFSGGIGEFGVDGQTAQELIRNVDDALYRAKNGGRDKILAVGEVTTTRRISIKRPGYLRTQVYVVVGAAPRVGSTSFCLALAGYLAPRYPVEIIDAGGGAINWVKKGKIKVRKAPPWSITPGVITLVDAGHYIVDEIQPFADMVFLVTDLSRSAVQFRPYIEKAKNICLVGNRGASLKGLHELGELWGIPVLGTLTEEPIIKTAEINGEIVTPKRWRKPLEKARRVIT